MSRSVRTACIFDGLRRAGLLLAFAISLAAVCLPFGSEALAQSSTQVTVTLTLNVTVTATVDTSKVQSATRSAIQGFLSQRANLLTTAGPDTGRAHARLGGGTLFGDSETASNLEAGFAEEARGVGRPNLGMGISVASRLGDEALPGRGFGSPASPASSFGASTGIQALGGTMSGSLYGVVGAVDRLSMLPGNPGNFGLDQAGAAFGSTLAAPFGWTREYEADPTAGRQTPSAFRFSGAHDNGIGRFAFATSLSQIREAAEAQETAKLAGVAPMGLMGIRSPNRPGTPQGSLDVWVEGTSSYFVSDHIDGRRQGHAALVHAGVDTIVAPGLLVGVMGSWDWMSDTSNGGLQRDGRGWMVGPYLSARLTRNLYFDARSTWGQSTNHVDPLGAYTDTYSTSRALASAKLTGDWTYGNVRFRPSAEVVWFSETAKAYTNTIGISIAEQTFSVGRAVFGPEVGYRLLLSDKSVLEPFVGIKGVWDFTRTQEVTATGLQVGGDGVRGRIEAGVGYRAPSGIMIRAAGAYDGNGGGGYRAVQGQASVVVPLQ